MSEVKFCPFCGKGLISGAKFCPYCGNQVSWLMEQKAPQAEEKKTTLPSPPTRPSRPPPLRPRSAAWPTPKAEEARGPCPWLSKRGGGLVFICQRTKKGLYMESAIRFCDDPKEWPTCIFVRQ